LRANDIVGVELFATGQALHDGTIAKIKTLGLTGDTRLPAIVWRSIGETQRYQTVATAVGACGQSPSILPCVARVFRTVANRTTATEVRAPTAGIVGAVVLRSTFGAFGAYARAVVGWHAIGKRYSRSMKIAP